jgi:RIO kinase 1
MAGEERLLEPVGAGVPVDYEFLLRRLKRGKLEKDSESQKIMAEVFDQSTLMTLYHLMNKGVFDELHGVVSTGKEANIFLARDRDQNPLAIKIYRIATTDFRTMWRYLAGDPRFQSLRKSRRHIILAWAKREYKNLMRAQKAEIPAPKPIDVRGNVLAMEFLGEEGLPYPRMKDRQPEDPKATFEKLLEHVKTLYHEAELVHSDLSEYNVLVTPEPVLIDFSMATDVANPMSDEWLRRDIENLTSYFRKLGVEVRVADELFAEIKSE